MGKHSRCVIDIGENNMQYPELQKIYSNVDADTIIQELPKDGAVKVAWIDTISKGKKGLVQESFHIFVTTSLLGWLINSSQCLIKSIQVQRGNPSAECFSSPSPIYHEEIKSIQI